jgi:lipopolysaccharide export system protein LptC
MLKHHSGQLFPIALLALLAALTYWLDVRLALKAERPDWRQEHRPDTIVDDFEIRRLNAEGVLQYRLKAPHLVHYPDDDSAEVTTPHITLYRPSGAPLTLLGQMAHVSAKGERVFFPGQVDIDRAASPDNQALTARTTDLTVLPEEGLASTDQHVFMTLGASELQGTGARIDNKAQTFELLANVTGRYVAQKAAP